MPGRHITLSWQHNPTLYAPARFRKACRYEAYIPAHLADLQFSLTGSVAGVVSDAENAIRTLNSSALPALVPMARLLLRTESIASSKIEGLQLGIRELARSEVRSETGQHVGPTALEVLANIDAMQLAVDNAMSTEIFTVDDITAIHSRLMANVPHADRIAGKLREIQNWIGGNDYNPCGADFVPPPADYVSPLLADLCAAVNDETLPPLVQAALVHAQFETIHPFLDGNGRAGRALVQVVLRRRGLAPNYVPPISIVLANRKDRYIDGLNAFREDRIEAWVDHFAAAAASAATLAEIYLRRVQSLTETWRSRLREAAAPRSDAAAWSIINVLPAHPMITAPVAAAATGRAKPSIYDAIRQLEKAGVLVPLSTSRRNQSWEAVGLFDVLSDLEAGQSPSA